MELTTRQTEEVLQGFLVKENGLNDVLQMMLNAMMLCEREAHLSSCSSENKGNGYRAGRVFGFGQQLELCIPRDRLSSFQPTLLALFRDQQEYVKEVCFQLYSKGLTTRDISDTMDILYGKHYSKSQVSNISQGFYEQLEAWRNRDLSSHYLALYIDGLHVKVKRDNKYVNECFYIILGLGEDQKREVIAIVNFPNESAQAWLDIFMGLKKRGLQSIGLIVSDGLSGMENSITQAFGSKTMHQKCIVHLQRNLQAYVNRVDKSLLAEDFRGVLDPDNPLYTMDQVPGRLASFREKWGSKYKALDRYLAGFQWQPYFTYLNYDTRVRRMIYTTNWIERFNKSCRRTLKIRGAFPNEESVLALITSVAMEKGDKQYAYPVHNFKHEPQLYSTKTKLIMSN